MTHQEQPLDNQEQQADNKLNEAKHSLEIARLIDELEQTHQTIRKKMDLLRKINKELESPSSTLSTESRKEHREKANRLIQELQIDIDNFDKIRDRLFGLVPGLREQIEANPSTLREAEQSTQSPTQGTSRENTPDTSAQATPSSGNVSPQERGSNTETSNDNASAGSNSFDDSSRLLELIRERDEIDREIKKINQSLRWGRKGTALAAVYSFHSLGMGALIGSTIGHLALNSLVPVGAILGLAFGIKFIKGMRRRTKNRLDDLRMTYAQKLYEIGEVEARLRNGRPPSNPAHDMLNKMIEDRNRSPLVPSQQSRMRRIIMGIPDWFSGKDRYVRSR